MPWVKLDDGFWDHPKILAVGVRLAVLHQRAMMWSVRHATGGHIPREALRAVGITKTQARTFVGVRLWDEVENGWRIHDWDVYNPSSESQKNRRDSWEKQRQKWRSEKAAQRARKKQEPLQKGTDKSENVRGQSADSPPDELRDFDEERLVSSRHVTSYDSDSDSDEGTLAAPTPTPPPMATATAPPNHEPPQPVSLRDAIHQAAANGSPVMAAVLRLATPSQDGVSGG